MLVQDRARLRGDLQVIRRNASNGRVISFWEKKNVITFGAGVSAIILLAPNASFGVNAQLENQIRSMRFGTSNLAPQRSDTQLAAEATVLGVPVRQELPDANRIVGIAGTVEFVAVLDAATGNGVTYREAGLFTRGTADDPQVTAGATLFSRQIYPDQPKTSIVELEYRWRITLTV
jgi:hypothetical protein